MISDLGLGIAGCGMNDKGLSLLAFRPESPAFSFTFLL